MLSLLKQRVLGQPAFAGEQLQRARQALRACAEQAHAVLGALGGGPDAAAVAALEAMQRFAVRTTLPVLGAKGGLHAFPWLEQAVWEHAPALRPAGGLGRAGDGRGLVHTCLPGVIACCLQVAACQGA